LSKKTATYKTENEIIKLTLKEQISGEDIVRMGGGWNWPIEHVRDAEPTYITTRLFI
jgi:hypothetical protein